MSTLDFQSLMSYGGGWGCGPSSFSTPYFMGAGGSGSGIDYSKLICSMMSQYSSSSSTSSSDSSKLTPEEREKKLAEEIDKAEEKIDTAKAEVKKEETALEEKTEAKKAEVGREYGWGDWLTSVGKGATGILTDMVCDKDEKGNRHPSFTKFLKTGVVVAAGVGLAAVAASGIAIAGVALAPIAGAVLTTATVAGGVLSAAQIGKGIADKGSAETFAAKDAAVQEITEGIVGGALTVLGFKGAGLLKGAKVEKAAMKLNSAIDGLKEAPIARLAARNSAVENAVMSVVKEQGLAENAKLIEILNESIKTTKPLTYKDFDAAKVTNVAKKIKIMKAFQKATSENPIPNVSQTAEDVEAILAIEIQAKILQAPKNSSGTIKHASETLTKLLQLTSKDGITPELAAELERLQQTPKIAKLLKLTGNKSVKVGKMVNDIGGIESGVISALKRANVTSPADKALVTEALEMLSNLEKTGADSEKLIAALKGLKESKTLSLDTLSKINLDEAIAALAPKAIDTVKAMGRRAIGEVVSTPRKIARLTKQVVTYPAREKGEAALVAARSSIITPQSSNMLSEIQRQVRQQARLAELEKGIKDQTGKTNTAKSNYGEKVIALAKIYKIELKDDKHEAKTIAQLEKEIAEARDNARIKKEALAQVKKEKEENAAA